MIVDEIIRLLEYITNHPIFQSAVIGFAVVALIIIFLVVCFFILVMKEIFGR